LYPGEILDSTETDISRRNSRLSDRIGQQMADTGHENGVRWDADNALEMLLVQRAAPPRNGLGMSQSLYRSMIGSKTSRQNLALLWLPHCSTARFRPASEDLTAGSPPTAQRSTLSRTMTLIWTTSALLRTIF